MSIKFPRLFYYDEQSNCWSPSPRQIENILDLSAFWDNGEEIEVRFKRIDMSDEDFDNLPEAD